jgi:hypothetical protein
MNAVTKNTKSLTAVNPQLSRPEWAIKLCDPFGEPVRVLEEEGYFFTLESAMERVCELNAAEDFYTIRNYYATMRATEGGF